jgi:very-short-patch-repair endonuclease
MPAIEAWVNEWGMDPYEWDQRGTGIKLTPIEAALWHDIRAEACVLYPQLPVGRFFVDFGNPAAKVAIECDGAAWHTDEAKDKARQAEIEHMGWTVYRITGSDCFTDFIEGEAESGAPLIKAGAARLLIRQIANRHGISVKSRRADL